MKLKDILVGMTVYIKESSNLIADREKGLIVKGIQIRKHKHNRRISSF